MTGYKKIKDLNTLNDFEVAKSDNFIISNGKQTFKLSVENLEKFLNIENLDNDGTLTVNTTHIKCYASEDLKKGDIVTIFPFDYTDDKELNFRDGDYAVANCRKSNIDQDTLHGMVIADSLTGQICKVLNYGIIDHLNTFNYEYGDLLYGDNSGGWSNQTDSKKKKAFGVVLHKSETYGAVFCYFDFFENNLSENIYFEDTLGIDANTVQEAIDQVFKKSNKTMFHTDRILIENNQIAVPKVIEGHAVNGSLRIWDTETSNAFEEYECEPTELYDKFLIDAEDSLDGKFASVTYLTLKI